MSELSILCINTLISNHQNAIDSSQVTPKKKQNSCTTSPIKLIIEPNPSPPPPPPAAPPVVEPIPQKPCTVIKGKHPSQWTVSILIIT